MWQMEHFRIKHTNTANSIVDPRSYQDLSCLIIAVTSAGMTKVVTTQVITFLFITWIPF